MLATEKLSEKASLYAHLEYLERERHSLDLAISDVKRRLGELTKPPEKKRQRRELCECPGTEPGTDCNCGGYKPEF